MTADKRTVTTDALETLGMIIGEKEKRDAIHLAVDPVTAAETLRPGEHVGFLGDGIVGDCDNPVGIVDPFLSAPVKKGQKFWLVIYPRKITSLRHVWTHPEFPEEKDAAPERPSETWLRNYAASFPVHYDEMIQRATEYLDGGEFWSQGGRFEGCSIDSEFWDHYEAVTGRKVKASDRGSFFSCSC